MTGRIHIRDLRLRTIIGVHDRERTQRQDVSLNLELETDLAVPAASDNIDDAVDYGALVRMLVGHVEESRYHLIERLASSVADLVLKQFPPVSAVSVTVDKPGAIGFARSVAVSLRKARGRGPND